MMEKLVAEFGLGIVCFFCTLMFVINSHFIWGVLVGLVITLFGLFFMDE